MSETPSPSTVTPARLARHALLFGGIAGVLGSLWMLFEFGLAQRGVASSSGRYLEFAGMLIPIGATLYGLMRWRDGVLGGTIRFQQAFGVALGIGLVFAAILAAFSYLYVSAINPSLIEAAIQQHAEALRQAGKTAEEIAKQTELDRAAFTPGVFAYQFFSRGLVTAGVISFAASLLIRKRPL